MTYPVHASAVQLTNEFARILRLPRRTWTDAISAQVTREMTGLLRRDCGQQTLRPIQAIALYEIGLHNGLLAQIRVGAGKTLISLLAPFVAQAKRPLLIVPAKLVEKTKRAHRDLSSHWLIPSFVKIVSYEWLSRVSAAQFLSFHYQPDMIVLDECQHVANPKAGVTRRLSRHFHDRPQTICVAMSGTITKRSIKDWAHIARWCQPATKVPLPKGRELQDWADAIDEKTSGQNIGLGYLSLFCPEGQIVTLANVRRGFSKRIADTPGFVFTSDRGIDASLMIGAYLQEPRSCINEAFATLRSSWMTPDGWPLTDPMSVRRVARELALGFYYRWDPRPPNAWLDARRSWSSLCHEILSTNRSDIDTPYQLTQALQSSDRWSEARRVYEYWKAIEPTFTPNCTPVWLDDSYLEAARDWALLYRSIVWSEHVAVGERLAKISGLDYYREEGKRTDGTPIEKADTDRPLIASVASNAEGRNLQTWADNLILSCPQNGRQFEQLLGRTHREGQTADTVTATVICSCWEHVRAFEQSKADAKYIEDTTGQIQKLSYADIDYPTYETIRQYSGARWSAP